MLTGDFLGRIVPGGILVTLCERLPIMHGMASNYFTTSVVFSEKKRSPEWKGGRHRV
jgi:hypothetical protein